MAATTLHSIVCMLAVVSTAGVRQQGGTNDTDGRLSVDDAPPLTTGRYFIFVEVYQIDTTGESIANVGKKVDSLLEETASSGDAEGADASALYHTEVVFCDRNSMEPNQTQELTDIVAGMKGYQKIATEFWQHATNVECTTLSYGGGPKEGNCSGVSHFKQKLSDIRAGIGAYYRNDAGKVWKYVYGTSDKSSFDAKNAECETCGDSWSQTKYGPVARNCNFWSKEILCCQLGLDCNLPWLSISNMRPLMSCKSCGAF